MSLELVGDIGGTNARFALIEQEAQPPLKLQHVLTLKCEDYPTIVNAIEFYFSQLQLGEPPVNAVLAVAAPVLSDAIDMTNHGWAFSVAETGQHLGIKILEVINDLKAVALGIPDLNSGDFLQIGTASSAGIIANGTYGIISPGTGLGVGAMVHQDGSRVALESEGGHIGFSPCNATEEKIASFLANEYGRVSMERVLSGTGLCNIYTALANLHQVSALPITPEQITERALGVEDKLCCEALDIFCGILGSFAGDVALLLGAKTIFMGGGCVLPIRHYLESSQFRQRFEAKGRFHSHLKSIPTFIITNPDIGLMGAAKYLHRTMAEETP